MHHLKIDIINPEDNTIVKSDVNMTTDGKLSVCRDERPPVCPRWQRFSGCRGCRTRSVSPLEIVLRA